MLNITRSNQSAIPGLLERPEIILSESIKHYQENIRESYTINFYGSKRIYLLNLE